MRTLFPLLLCLAACGGGEPAPEAQANSVDELENRLDKLSDRTEEEIEKPHRLAYLQKADLTPEFEARAGCKLHQQGRLLLVVNAAGAVARIDGRRVPLTISGPTGPTGGFFSAPGVTFSVGREGSYAADAASYAPGWPAHATIGGDKSRPIEKHEATWICLR